MAFRTAFVPAAAADAWRRHKERSLVGHLPEARCRLVRPVLRAAWAQADVDAASPDLKANEPSCLGLTFTYDATTGAGYPLTFNTNQDILLTTKGSTSREGQRVGSRPTADVGLG